MSTPENRPVIEEAGRYSLTFSVPVDAPYLNGHFPDDPLVPAAQILAWLHAAVARVDPRFVTSGQVERAKFLAPLRPEMAVILEWEADGDGWRVQARTGEVIAVRAEFHPHTP